MKDPKNWSKSDLDHHLQHAIDLEFWTIPLYLTALYSIKGINNCVAKNYPSAAKLIQSVVIQEMLHLEIVCNLSNALGYRPKFSSPHYGHLRFIPFIHPEKDELSTMLQDYKIRLGALDVERLKLFCVIEYPEHKKKIQWAERDHYTSIGELYQSLEEALPHLWEIYYVGDKDNKKQKQTFTDYHNSDGRSHGFSQVIYSLDDALKALDAIVEQGEGANGHLVPADYRPHSDADKALQEEKLSHYEKFSMLLHHPKLLPPVHTAVGNRSEEQVELKKLFHQLLQDLETSFNLENKDMCVGFWDNMFAMKKQIAEVWESGECPEFEL